MKYRTNDIFRDYKTEYQWNKSGFAVKTDEKPIELWTNAYCQSSCLYYSPEQVRNMTDVEISDFKKSEALKRKIARDKLKEKKRLRVLKEEEIAKKEKEIANRYKRLNSKLEEIEKIISQKDKIEPYRDSIVVDVETTGFEAGKDELLQVSIIDSQGNVLYDSYLKPEVNISWFDAEKINGIIPNMVANAPDIVTEIPKIHEIISSANSIIGYCFDFDYDFLQAYGIKFDYDKIFDVAKEFAIIYGEWDEYHQDYRFKKLVECASYYKYDWSKSKAHNSLSDCYATLHCYKSITKG